jgi:hypothetical protein
MAVGWFTILLYSNCRMSVYICGTRVTRCNRQTFLEGWNLGVELMKPIFMQINFLALHPYNYYRFYLFYKQHIT